MLYRVVWVSIHWGEIYNFIYNKTVQLIILHCFDAVGRMASRFPFSAPAACLELAAINSSHQGLSICFQILKLKKKLFYSHKLSLNTDPTCRQRLWSYDRMALYKSHYIIKYFILLF